MLPGRKAVPSNIEWETCVRWTITLCTDLLVGMRCSSWTVWCSSAGPCYLRSLHPPAHYRMAIMFLQNVNLEGPRCRVPFSPLYSFVCLVNKRGEKKSMMKLTDIQKTWKGSLPQKQYLRKAEMSSGIMLWFTLAFLCYTLALTDQVTTEEDACGNIKEE